MSPIVDLAGKREIVIGIANEHSIAAGCAMAFRQAGAGDVGRVAAFLASEAGSSLTGSVVYADGGFHTIA